MLEQPSVSLDDARRVIAAGEAKAREIASPSNIAVVDAGGVPLRRGNQIVGAVGVSGDSGEQDQTVADAAVTAL